MKTLEHGQDKIQKICDVLRHETLEPAKRASENILAEARAEAARIITEAARQGEALISQAKKTMEQERNVFQSALVQAAKQSLEALRQSIEEKLFNQELGNLLRTEMTDPKVIAALIHAIISAIEKQGMATDLVALIPQTVSVKAVNELLLSKISVATGEMTGGVQLQMRDRKMTLDVTDAALKELLTTYLRKDFRKLVFAA